MGQIFLVCAVGLLPLWHSLSAQEVTALATRWDDSFQEWLLFDDYAQEEGYLRRRWPNGGNWGEWEYQIGEAIGTIQLKWGQNPNEWELRGDNIIVTARTVWPNQFQEWRLSDGDCILTLRSRYGNVMEEWESRSSGCGQWVSYTAYEGDPRDWIVESQLDRFHLSLMAAFITVFHSTPRQ